MSLLERISIDPEVVHGRPVVRGTRLRVADVLSLLASGASEAEILADYPYLAETHGAVIVTKDEDFANMAALDGDAPPVVWVRVGNTRRTALLAWFEQQIAEAVSLVEAGSRVIELR